MLQKTSAFHVTELGPNTVRATVALHVQSEGLYLYPPAIQ